MPDDVFKFTVHSTEYGSLLDNDLASIRKLLGEFEVVKVRKCPFTPWHMKIWVKRKIMPWEKQNNEKGVRVQPTK